MDALEHVDVLEWKVVPILSTVSFDTGLKKIKEIIISDTSLVDFDIFKNIEDLAVLNINNNRYMESIDSNAKTISRQLSISANARDLVVSFPQIEWANNITIRDVVSADLPTLEFVNNSAEFIDNFFTELKLPNVKSIGGTLGIIENYHLKNVDLEEVSDIFGGLMITNNSEIETINFLPNLQHIGGAIQFDGKFKDTNFPKLKLVKGSVFINTNSNNMNCNKWTAPENGLSIIRGGKIICISGRKQSTVRLSEDGQILNKDESDVAEETQIKENSGNMGILNNKISISWVIGFAIIAVLLTIPY
ncbi:uncharacterized protein SCDLUD_003828 [Saccharomycodes ludwigii]|nr:hypothetical protein SCDLUD_003828 [Saccharomycodes ludwigii]KAH3899551.1 hypothetical protein SCDLUD_003828 [Saccharomycodes ludwigii]